ncbi:hypothetical protein BDK51DRAFT_26189, partial [Blyttiomyces helicus]
LKRYVKRSKNFNVNKQIQQLVEKLEQNSRFIEQRRSAVDFSPREEGKAAAFLADIDPNLSPLYKHNAARQKLREQEIARRHAQERVESKDGADDEDEDDFSEEDEEEDEAPRKAKKGSESKRVKKAAIGEDEDEGDGRDDGLEGDDDLVEDFNLSDF